MRTTAVLKHAFIEVPLPVLEQDSKSNAGDASNAKPTTASAASGLHHRRPLEAGVSTLVIVGFVFLLLVLVMGAGVMLFDFAGRREEDAWWLQMKILETLRRDPVLSRCRILPVVTVPASPRAALAIEVSGEVPSELDREAALELVREIANKLRRGGVIDDRLVIAGRTPRPGVA